MMISMSSQVTGHAQSLMPRRFGLWSLFRLQLLLCPVFLAPLYLHSRQHDVFLDAVAALLAPICYVAALVLLFPATDRRAVPAFAQIRRGAALGVLFGSLSMIPAQLLMSMGHIRVWLLEVALLPHLANPATRAALWSDPERLLGYLNVLFSFPFFFLLILVQYALIGAAVSGVIALATDRRCAMESACNEPSPHAPR